MIKIHPTRLVECDVSVNCQLYSMKLKKTCGETRCINDAIMLFLLRKLFMLDPIPVLQINTFIIPC